MRKLCAPLIVVLLAGCIDRGQFGNIGEASDVSLELNPLSIDTSKYKWVQVLEDPGAVKELLAEISGAEGLGPLKCAPSRWHKLVVFRGDAMTDFRTNGEIFEDSRTGRFYKFRSKNILKEYFHIDTDRRE